MTRKVDERVRIRSKEWIDAQEKTSMGSIPNLEGNIFVTPMFEYAGRTAHITKEAGGKYRLDIDNGEWCWNDWMFDPGHNPADEPLSAIDAIIAMVRGKETLYDKAGQKYFFELDPGERYYEEFVCLNRDGAVEKNHIFTGLCRHPEKRKRDMTRWEILAWANSEESRGWVVNFDNSDWVSPQCRSYSGELKNHQRARLLPDLSGIDESTICGFEAEE
jgi:hypothetical protein